MEKERTAEELAMKQRAISVAEFFEKNRHLLGFDNPAKALLTVVKEAVDNSMDATEEARILPEIFVGIEDKGEDRFRIIIEDNGPGIVKKQIPKIFGKLLYGSKFHTLSQSRGQQGIGISAAVLYAQLTTGRPAIIYSKTKDKGPTKTFHLKIDTLKNEPEIIQEEDNHALDHKGTRIELEIEGKYLQRYHSVEEYLKQTAIVNPYAHIIYKSPNGEKFEYSRAVKSLPKMPKGIKPHPYGVELGILIRMLKSTEHSKLKSFLTEEFCRIGSTSAEEISRLAGLDSSKKPKSLNHEEQEKLLKAMQRVKIMRPPTNCLSPIGGKLIEEGLKKEIKAEFITAVTRDPVVYRGNPFQIEAGIAYGGELEQEIKEEIRKHEEEARTEAKLMRFANRVPLLYQASSCAITRAVSKINWRRYGLEQPGGRGLPRGPVVILVHMCSTWVPFTSESKESIANYPEIVDEIKLAVQECARNMLRHLRKQKRAKRETMRLEIFKKYLPLIVTNAEELAEVKKKHKVDPILEKVINTKLVEESGEEGEYIGKEESNEKKERKERNE